MGEADARDDFGSVSTKVHACMCAVLLHDHLDCALVSDQLINLIICRIFYEMNRVAATFGSITYVHLSVVSFKISLIFRRVEAKESDLLFRNMEFDCISSGTSDRAKTTGRAIFLYLTRSRRNFFRFDLS